MCIVCDYLYVFIHRIFMGIIYTEHPTHLFCCSRSLSLDGSTHIVGGMSWCGTRWRLKRLNEINYIILSHVWNRFQTSCQEVDRRGRYISDHLWKKKWCGRRRRRRRRRQQLNRASAIVCKKIKQHSGKYNIIFIALHAWAYICVRRVPAQIANVFDLNLNDLLSPPPSIFRQHDSMSQNMQIDIECLSSTQPQTILGLKMHGCRM